MYSKTAAEEIIFIYYPAVLDDDTMPGEALDQIKRLKPGKAAGVDGIPAGALKWLPDDWILLLTNVMNNVFYGMCPKAWTVAKLSAIHKKGNI